MRHGVSSNGSDASRYRMARCSLPSECEERLVLQQDTSVRRPLGKVHTTNQLEREVLDMQQSNKNREPQKFTLCAAQHSSTIPSLSHNPQQMHGNHQAPF
eukprot:scaffold250981_cov21-Tisochrysis_lutea.AAC.1